MSTLRLIAVTLLILPVAAIMLATGAIAYALTLVTWPFCYLRNTSALLLEALLKELFSGLASALRRGQQ